MASRSTVRAADPRFRGLLVAIDPAQDDHVSFADALTSHPGPLVISPFVVAELDHVIGRDYGNESRLAFLDEIDRGAYRLEAFEVADFSRAREITREHPRLPGLGMADASNVVLAERYGAVDILTTDQRDFRRIELPGGDYFRILPYDL